MSNYTDPNFDFSFWYPSGWTVRQISVQNPNQYPGGTVVRELQISNTLPPTSGKYVSVTIQEYHSANGMITSDCSTYCDNGDRFPDTRYYFDSTANKWMYQGFDPDSGPSWTTPYPADISRTTMGGLYLFDIYTDDDKHVKNIVPLDPQNFLIVEELDLGNMDGYLTATIAGTHASAAVPASVVLQQATMQAEANAFEMFTSSGNFVNPYFRVPASSGKAPFTVTPGTYTATLFDSQENGGIRTITVTK